MIGIALIVGSLTCLVLVLNDLRRARQKRAQWAKAWLEHFKHEQEQASKDWPEYWKSKGANDPRP